MRYLMEQLYRRTLQPIAIKNASKVTFTPGDANTGTVIISATCSKAAYLCAIEIDCEEPSSIVPVTGITLNKTTTSIPNGETETLVATVIPENATKQTVTWTSSDMNVATVSAGVVTAVGVGTSTITATTVDGGFTASCDVTVATGHDEREQLEQYRCRDRCPEPSGKF
mgnify:CR=1 FL=1